jgi:hypothetical protein
MGWAPSLHGPRDEPTDRFVSFDRFVPFESKVAKDRLGGKGLGCEPTLIVYTGWQLN